ncbi:hypothetical protein [Neisseria wadsworthii]|uniref:Uncharacterized protein n=1 Tax=Neisseria wadsworthii 9715 TaxID=1030841 RepID=G4CPU3_9NEIS|nr:hypothetical protein [Neisseria wadsworthii]EGZ47450.1 hypothetical protein HMPREF9370_1103 [Neisseria wadsworthii 9715]QMT36833.1 hypothetical protein H3L96_07325 [Neisseria wadsworthii]
MNAASANNMLFHWLAVCLIPLVTIVYFTFNPAQTPANHLTYGIILACECVFLFKYVLFKFLAAHLKEQPQVKRQFARLFLPPVILTGYICHYFGLF